MRYNQVVMLNSLSLDPTQPITWLAGSVAAAIVITNLAWLIAGRGSRRVATGGQIVAWLVTALFFMLPPVLAWQAGALSPFYLGLSGIDWIPTLLTGAPLTGLIIGVLWVGWLAYRRTLPQPARTIGSRQEHLVAALRAPLDAALRQWHWAFYRATAIAWIATWTPARDWLARVAKIDLAADPLYWGSWLGLLFLAAEWSLNPFARAALRDPRRQAASFRQVILAAATAALFALTRNLWLCLICHILTETVIVGWLTVAQDTPIQPSP